MGSLGCGNSPSTTCRSVRQTPQADTATRISPAPGCGTGRSRMTRGWPGRSRTMARIAFIDITFAHPGFRSPESHIGVLAGLVPATPRLKAQSENNQGGRNKPGHDPAERPDPNPLNPGWRANEIHDKCKCRAPRDEATEGGRFIRAPRLTLQHNILHLLCLRRARAHQEAEIGTGRDIARAHPHVFLHELRARREPADA